jgi:hypothetical protein
MRTPGIYPVKLRLSVEQKNRINFTGDIIMAAWTIEERLNSLEDNDNSLVERNRELEHEIARLQAVHEIENLMGRYRYWHSGHRYEEMGKMFAEKTPGVRVELANSGVFEGYEGAWKIMVDFHNWSAKQHGPGRLEILQINTPVIEVAKDGKTARGLWTAMRCGAGSPEGKLGANWGVEQYAVDFVKEDGTWKFWHFHLYWVLRCPFETSWVEAAPTPGVPPDKIPFDLRPDRPTTYHKMYSPTSDPSCGLMEFVPPSPDPYETWEESMASIQL